MSTNNHHQNGSAIRHAQEVADNLRLRVFEYVLRNNGGYLSQACSSAEILATLYTMVMKLDASQAPLIPQPFGGVPGADNPNFFNGGQYNGPQAPQLDRFIFSPAHYALALYAVLIEVGRLAPEGLEMFNADGSTVEMIGAEHSPGIETTTGSLSQAISQAGGIALARRLKGDSGRVWVFMSDGELQEGQTWEALQALAWHRLDNIGIFVDVNGQQVEGRMETVMNIEPIAARMEAFGARVFEVDGHDIDALYHPTTLLPDGRPLVVLARTDPTRGIPLLKEYAPKLHTIKFKSAEERERFQLAYLLTKRLHGARRNNGESAEVELDAVALDTLYEVIHSLREWTNKSGQDMQPHDPSLGEIDAIIDAVLTGEN